MSTISLATSKREAVHGKVVGVGGSAELIGDAIDGSLTLGQLVEDHIDELVIVARTATYHPAGAEDIVRPTRIAHVNLAIELGRAVHHDRIGLVGLGVI